jgi:peroxiredoxin
MLRRRVPIAVLKTGRPPHVDFAFHHRAALAAACRQRGQNGRILLRLEAIERQLSTARGKPTPRSQAEGLALGSAAPEFELPSLESVPHKLSQFRGRDVLLVFFNPGCGFCTKMAADLAALPVDVRGDHAMPLVVTTGGAEENRKLVERYGIRCPVLLQNEMEVASQYRARGTPMGYRIDCEGRIASELAVGAEPLLQLAASPAPSNAPAPRENSASKGRRGKKADPSLARSRLNRDGLRAGAIAPDFCLARIDGGELSLMEIVDRARSWRRVFRRFTSAAPICKSWSSAGATPRPIAPRRRS